MGDRILVLVRHGETVGKSSVRLYGATDIDLSERGREQMRKVHSALENHKFQKVITSPLIRSKESASIIMDGYPHNPTIVKDFAEINFGRWEGWTFKEAEERDPEVYNAWQTTGWDFSFPEGDSRRGFHGRVSNAAEYVFSEPSGKTLAVLHKGVIKVIIAALLNVDYEEIKKYPVELGSIHRLKKTENGWKAISTNETEHLGDSRIPSSI